MRSTWNPDGAYPLDRLHQKGPVSQEPGITKARCHLGMVSHWEANGVARGGVYLGGLTMTQRSQPEANKWGLPDEVDTNDTTDGGAGGLSTALSAVAALLLVFLQCGRRLSPDPTTGSVSSRLRLKDASAACPRRPRERDTLRLRKSPVCA